MDWIKSLLEWAEAHDALLWWLFATSLVLILMTPLGVGWAVLRLPADYFTERRRPLETLKPNAALRAVTLVLKNLLGMILLLAGIVMLLVPGQGLLTIVVGLILIDFPGKFRLERWLATRRPVWRSLNWLRDRAGREKLKRPS